MTNLPTCPLCGNIIANHESHDVDTHRAEMVQPIEAARDEAAVRNARDFGTDPSWYGR